MMSACSCRVSESFSWSMRSLQSMPSYLTSWVDMTLSSGPSLPLRWGWSWEKEGGEAMKEGPGLVGTEVGEELPEDDRAVLRSGGTT